MIKEIIYNYWDSELPEVIERDIKPELKTELIIDIVGVRRSGKTYLMFGIIKKITKKTNKKATLYINFENRKLLPLTPNYFNQVIDFIYQEKLLDKYKKIYLFFDEIQRIKDWERFIRSISGSSANLLSKEYGKLLSGRHLTIPVFPLTFKEFLRFKNFEIKILSEKRIAQIKRLLEEYLKFGGFPEVVLQRTKKKKEAILNQLFIDILSRDILGRAETRKAQIIEEFSYFLCSNVSNLLSFRKMANYFNSRGIKISVPTLESYFYLTKNAFLFFELLIFSYKVKDQLQYPRKIYCIDNGLVNLIGFKFSQNLGKICENTVAIELLRKSFSQPTLKVFYWKNPQNQEVDFVIKKKLKITQLIQVCYNLEDYQTKQRELKSLYKASQELNCNNLLVITWDYEGKEKFKNKTIKFIPLWKWLLQ